MDASSGEAKPVRQALCLFDIKAATQNYRGEYGCLYGIFLWHRFQ